MRTPVFVGRRREAAKLRAALSDARDGTGSVVLVAGEAGIGKTSLAEEVSRAAAWLGTPSVWGPAIEAEAAPPYWPWRQVLAGIVRIDACHQAPDPAALLRGAASQFALSEAVVAALREAAEPAGLLVVLDDLHWADSSSLRLLQITASQVPASKLVILCTYRPPESGEASAIAVALPALLRERAVTRITLAGLDRADSEAVLSQALERPVNPILARSLFEQTDGNPFYLVELAEAIRTHNPNTQLPESLDRIARSRLGSVGAESRQVLGLAAVIGRDFDIDLLKLATDVSPTAVQGHVAEAAGAGLVNEIAAGHYRFAHALLREALYRDLPPSERIASHARIAEALRATPESSPESGIEARSHHLRNGLPLVDADVALEATVAAAEAAYAQLAFSQAADRYLDAIELADRSDVPGSPRADLLVRLAQSQYQSGEVARAWESCEVAAAAARREGNLSALAGAALVMRGMLDARIAGPLLRLCEEALRQWSGADAVVEARLLAQASIARGALRIIPTLAQEALESARRSGDPEARLRALQARELEIAGDPACARERFELSQEAVDATHEMGDVALQMWAHGWRLGASWELGLRGEADNQLTALAAAVERLKEPMARWRLETASSTLALIDGRYADAATSAERAQGIGRRAGHVEAARFALVLKQLAAARTGDTSSDAAFRASADGDLGIRLWYASHLADQGRLEEVRSLLAGVSLPAANVAGPEGWLVRAMGAAKLAVAVEHAEWAAEVYEGIRPFAHLHVVVGSLGGYEGPIALYAGELAALLGRRSEAEELLRQAIDSAAALGSPPFVALARHKLARLLARSGRPRDRSLAVSLLKESRTTADRLGMHPLAVAIAHDLRLLEGPQPAATNLSKREVEVAAMVAQGLTNRLIADRLHISPRTAENHVKHILDKLGFDSRSEIAAWSAGLLER